MCAVCEPIALAASAPAPEWSTNSLNSSCRRHKNWSSWKRPLVPCAAACSSHNGPGFARFSSAPARRCSTHGWKTPRSTIAPSLEKRSTSASVRTAAGSTRVSTDKARRSSGRAGRRRSALGTMTDATRILSCHTPLWRRSCRLFVTWESGVFSCVKFEDLNRKKTGIGRISSTTSKRGARQLGSQ